MNQKMITLILLFTCIITVRLVAQPASRQVPKQWTNGGYLEYLPAGYDSTSPQLYPAIIFLHGSGERGMGTPTDLQKLVGNGPPKMIKNGHDMCFTVGGVNECFIVLSPQTNQWDFVGVGAPFARWAKTHYKIDPNRLYVTGLSMGGRGSWTAGYEMIAGETLFSAMVPVAANGSSAYGTAAEANNIRVWAIHGDQDTAIPLSDGKIPVDAMVKLKADPAPIFTIDPGSDHNKTYERAYRTDHSVYNPNLYEWFLLLNRPTVNNPPTVSGSDQIIAWPVNYTTLTATASDPDAGDVITSYYWYKKNGGTLTLMDFKDFTTANLKLSNLQPGTHAFILLAVNDKGQHAYDDVTLVVNQLPVVNAGADQVVSLPANTATLTATASDPNPGGSIKSYLWSKVSGPSVTILNSTKAIANLSQLVVGTYIFEVKVTDNNNAIATDQVQVIVTATNALPTVNAGPDVTIHLPANSTTLTANATDSDGTIVEYIWEKVSGPSVTMSGGTTTSLAISNLVAGNYIFRTTVKDNLNATASDDVQVLVNEPPVVNAGADQFITLPTNSTTLSGAATDADDAIGAYIWTQVSGPTGATLSGIPTTTLSVSGLLQGIYTFRLTVTDTRGALSYDDAVVTVTAQQQPVVVFRVNNGGLEITDPELSWGLDKEGTDPTRRSPYLDITRATYTTGSNTWTGTNTTGAPNNIFGGNRYATTVGPMIWHFPTGNGSFKVKLFFAEKGGTGAVNGAGQRIFDVNAEGILAFNDIDIYSEAGMAALNREADVTVTDGTLDLEFVRDINNTQVNGIEIVRLSGAGARIGGGHHNEKITSEVELYSNSSVYAYPNPIASTTFIHFRNPQSGSIVLKVSGSTGKTVKEIQLQADDTSVIPLDLPVESMSSGLYLLEVKTKSGRKVIKLFNK
jgi:hypothetical protein